MSSNALTRARAETLLSAYGANPMRWPADERDALHAALQQWPELADLLVAEQALDAQLSASKVPSVVSVEGLLARIDKCPTDQGLTTFASAVSHQQRCEPSDGSSNHWQWWQMAMAACAPLALGVGLGMSGVETSDDWQGSEQYLFAPDYEEFIDG